MSGWLRGLDLGDVVHVAIVRCTLTGRPSCVESAVLRVTLRNGKTRDVPVSFDHQPMYETLVADIAAANDVFRAIAARRR